VASMPASYTINTFGARAGVGLGAVLIAAFGMLKGVGAANYTIVTVCQVGLAVAQPFVINAATRISAQWFPARERATATGIAILAQYVGIIVAMAVTPLLVKARNVDGMLFVYGIAALIAGALFIPLFRDRPAGAPIETGDRYGTVDGLRHIVRQKSMLMLLVMFFVGLGIFNAVTTWIEEILAPRGFTAEQAGAAGAVMMIGGILGASVLPALSDRTGRRVPFLVGTTVFAVPGLIGLAFAASYPLLLASSFLLGLASMSAGPIGFQYGAEVSHPAPESTSQGLLLLAGQVSGVIFIYGMDAFRSGGGSMTPFMLVFIVATACNAMLCMRLTEPQLARDTMGR
ncbi:MAG: major facilitator superfamily domain-containing protein 7, partial [Candidatus Hydrogenedentes bacterium]|nr:major facilitator superfamily domain-containing protein 7 [Candidatus Hydrogenedentota bacterium]